MPNWCENIITVSGPNESLKKFDERFQKPHTHYTGYSGSVRKEGYERKKKELDELLAKGEILEYRLILKTPDFHIELPQTDENDWYKYTALTEVKKEVKGYSLSNFVPMRKQDFLNSWDNWSIKNWGTKWDISDVLCNCYKGGELIDNITEADEIRYVFQTAWTPSCKVTEKMAELFPELSFRHDYSEPGVCLAGFVKFKDGAIAEHVFYEGEGDDFEEFLHAIWGLEYLKCAKCNALLEEWQLGLGANCAQEGSLCPECGSKKVYDTDHKTLIKLNQ